jgi:hypothetical protein
MKTAFLTVVAISMAASAAGFGCGSQAIQGNQQNQGCSVVGCLPNADINLPLPDGADQGSQIMVCHNSACVTGAVPAAPATANEGTTISWSPAAADPQATVWRNTDGTIRVEVQWYDVTTTTDGDSYSVTVTDASGATSASTTKVATYTTSMPNGDGCPPICHTATLANPQGG